MDLPDRVLIRRLSPTKLLLLRGSRDRRRRRWPLGRSGRRDREKDPSGKDVPVRDRAWGGWAAPPFLRLFLWSPLRRHRRFRFRFDRERHRA